MQIKIQKYYLMRYNSPSHLTKENYVKKNFYFYSDKLINCLLNYLTNKFISSQRRYFCNAQKLDTD